MNTQKYYNRNESRKKLSAVGLEWTSFNDDNHWKVSGVDFWPTTHKWLCPLTGEVEYGIKELINYLRPKQIKVNQLSVEKMFEIVKKSKATNLEKICEVLHREIYK